MEQTIRTTAGQTKRPKHFGVQFAANLESRIFAMSSTLLFVFIANTIHAVLLVERITVQKVVLAEAVLLEVERMTVQKVVLAKAVLLKVERMTVQKVVLAKAVHLKVERMTV